MSLGFQIFDQGFNNIKTDNMEREQTKDMQEPKFVITGVNALTGEREELSRPMEREEAEQRLEHEAMSRKFQRYAAHKQLRVEKRLPVQLTLNFLPYE